MVHIVVMPVVGKATNNSMVFPMERSLRLKTNREPFHPVIYSIVQAERVESILLWL